MSRPPLATRLKRRAHISIALAQDILMAEAYYAFPQCVLHGGTAIWRCYGGGRFSEDIDVYIPVRESGATRRFREGVAAKGMKELKFKVTENTVFGKYDHSGWVVSFEAALRTPPASVVKPYELLDGNLMLVRTLTPEDLILEKASAYASRRKVRDLYDVFFLLNLVDDRARVLESVTRMVEGQRKPVDPEQLRATVIAGVAPSWETMLEGIRRWAGQST
jgi:predicted nucleotidyltransferase component of viral defense system